MMSSVLPKTPYVGQDFYVPAYSIEVRGQDLLKETHDITSVTYTENINAIDSFDLVVNNEWLLDESKFKYSDEPTFMPWSPVRLRMGYFVKGDDQRRLMLSGEITTMSPTFPTAGPTTMAVRGLNLLHRFRLKQITKPFFNKKDTEIAQFLVGEIDKEMRQQFPNIRLKIKDKHVSDNLEREKPLKFLVIQNQYPIVFLMERARRIGYDLTIEELPREGSRSGTVTFGYAPTSSITRATYELEWGKTLMSAQPTLRVAGQVSKVTVRGWSPGRKEPISESATRSDLKKDKVGVVDPRELDLGEPAIAQEISVDRPVESKHEAKEMAKQILRQKASELVIVKAKTIGLPDLRVGSKVTILGLGERFSGKKNQPPFMFLVTDTTHTFADGGYTTDFTARMESGVTT
jgi:hypothetical protein